MVNEARDALTTHHSGAHRNRSAKELVPVVVPLLQPVRVHEAERVVGWVSLKTAQEGCFLRNQPRWHIERTRRCLQGVPGLCGGTS